MNRKQDDIKKYASLLQTYLQASVTITNVFCMGKKSNKPSDIQMLINSLIKEMICNCSSLAMNLI